MIEEIKDEEIEDLSPQRGPVWWIRQVINIVFIIGAVIGMYLYWKYPNNVWGIIIIVSAMVLKMFECALRVFKVNTIHRRKRKVGNF